MTDTYYISEADIKSKTAISQNVDASLIVPYFQLAQDIQIMPIITELLNESMLSKIDSKALITSITQANPAEVTTQEAHEYITGDDVTIYESAGMTKVNGSNKITVTGPTTFTLDGVDASSYSAYEAGSGFAVPMDLYEFKLWGYLINAMCWLSFSQSVPFIYAQFKNAAILRRTAGPDNQPVSMSEVKWYKGEVENKGQYFLECARKYIIDNVEHFPLFQSSDNCNKKRSSAWKTNVRF